MGKGASSLTHALCTSTNSLSVQGHISLPCAQSRRNGFATAMWADWAFRTNWRGAQLFADAGSNLWSMAAGGYARNRRNGRAGSRKKNRPLAMQTSWSSRQITDVLIWPCICTQQSLWSIVPHPGTANSCWHNDDVSIANLATSLMVKSIISSLVLQAILSIFSGHVLWQALVLYFRCRHRLQVFRNSGPQMHSYCENLFDSKSTPGICKTCNDSMQEPPVRISETAASLISHGTASGDRPKLSSMPIA